MEPIGCSETSVTTTKQKSEGVNYTVTDSCNLSRSEVITALNWNTALQAHDEVAALLHVILTPALDRAWPASSDYLLIRGGGVIILWIESMVDTWASPVALPLLGLEPGILGRWVSNVVTILTRITWLLLRWTLIRVRPVTTSYTYLQNHMKKVKCKCKLQMSPEINSRDQQNVSCDVVSSNAAENTRHQEQILGRQILILCCLCLLLRSIANPICVLWPSALLCRASSGSSEGADTTISRPSSALKMSAVHCSEMSVNYAPRSSAQL